jgi:hypothetical protein
MEKPVKSPKNSETKIEKDRLLETKEHPMDEMMFYALSNVYGFSKNNGKTYSEYLKIWKKRNE